MEKLKTLMVSSVLGLGLMSTAYAADDCIMVADLNVEFKNDSTVYMNGELSPKPNAPTCEDLTPSLISSDLTFAALFEDKS